MAENLAKLSKIENNSRHNCIRYHLFYLCKNIDKNTADFLCTICLFSGTIIRVANWFDAGARTCNEPSGRGSAEGVSDELRRQRSRRSFLL
ncbi:hypothetical protein MPLDJ20_110123 [Mesorhizobium plurifarium]|uniref:Uncharacterized protein n=1 Tax=Mesorhizobium plurifarium TaxID=69974 RepID=A0A090DTJ7_MESPL|nr:hypothetical protein MPLDJ20_110123 [Mesorhizobium plurifarium]